MQLTLKYYTGRPQQQVVRGAMSVAEWRECDAAAAAAAAAGQLTILYHPRTGLHAAPWVHRRSRRLLVLVVLILAQEAMDAVVGRRRRYYSRFGRLHRSPRRVHATTRRAASQVYQAQQEA